MSIVKLITMKLSRYLSILLRIVAIFIIGYSWIEQNSVYTNRRVRTSNNLMNYQHYMNSTIYHQNRMIMNLLVYNHLYSGLWAQDIYNSIFDGYQLFSILWNGILQEDSLIMHPLSISDDRPDYEGITYAKIYEVIKPYYESRVSTLNILMGTIDDESLVQQYYEDRGYELESMLDTLVDPTGLLDSIIVLEEVIEGNYKDRINEMMDDTETSGDKYVIMYVIGTMLYIIGLVVADKETQKFRMEMKNRGTKLKKRNPAR